MATATFAAKSSQPLCFDAPAHVKALSALVVFVKQTFTMIVVSARPSTNIPPTATLAVTSTHSGQPLPNEARSIPLAPPPADHLPAPANLRDASQPARRQPTCTTPANLHDAFHERVRARVAMSLYKPDSAGGLRRR
jgi:hypothetical protein